MSSRPVSVRHDVRPEETKDFVLELNICLAQESENVEDQPGKVDLLQSWSCFLVMG
jgi:hypothetical protein